MIDGGAMFGVVPKAIWQKIYPADENNLCNYCMRCLLVETGNRKVLIDTGIGNKQEERFFRLYHLNGDDSLEKSLHKNGLDFEDITDVIITHLHFDHCGGAVVYNKEASKYEPAFPNALYHIGKRQWDWAVNPNRRERASFLKENILPIAESGRLELLETGQEVLPGIKVRFFEGHTEGQVVPFIDYKGKTVVYVGDLLPTAANIPMAYIPAYDIRPLVTLEEKKAFFLEALQNDYILFFEHDIYVECCRLTETEKGVRCGEQFGIGEV